MVNELEGAAPAKNLREDSRIENGLAEACIRRWLQGIRWQSKLAFGVTFVLGLVTHLFMFVNKLPNGDDVASLYHDFSMITSGRWFDNPAMVLSSYYSMPWVTGLVALFFLSLSALLLCNLLKLERGTSVVLTAGLLATFPALASYFSYMFYSDLYMIALFLGLLAVWLAGQTTWGWLWGVLPLACCLGCYQAFIGVPVVVCLLSLIQEILKNQKSLREILLLALRYLLLGILGTLTYFLILKLGLNIFQLTLTDYQGIDGMGKITLTEIFSILPKTYSQFANYYLQDTFYPSPLYMKGVYGCLWIVGVWAVILALWRQGREGKRATQLLLIPLFALLPPAFNLTYFLAPKAFLHSLMQPQYMLMFVMPLCFFESALAGSQTMKGQGRLAPQARLKPGNSKPGGAMLGIGSWVLLIGTALVIYNSFLTVNICYLNLHLKYEITYATELRILDRIEQHPDYRRETPVLFLGCFPNDQQSLYPMHTQDFVKNMVGVNGNLVHHFHNYKGFYNNYLGVTLNFATEAQAAAIKPLVAQRKMPLWPARGSVDMIEGVMVVNISP